MTKTFRVTGQTLAGEPVSHDVSVPDCTTIDNAYPTVAKILDDQGVVLRGDRPVAIEPAADNKEVKPCN